MFFPHTRPAHTHESPQPVSAHRVTSRLLDTTGAVVALVNSTLRFDLQRLPAVVPQPPSRVSASLRRMARSCRRPSRPECPFLPLGVLRSSARRLSARPFRHWPQCRGLSTSRPDRHASEWLSTLHTFFAIHPHRRPCRRSRTLFQSSNLH